MFVRHLLFSCLIIFLGAGCQKSSSVKQESSKDVFPPASNTVLRIHWSGKRQLALNGSAFYFNRLWDLQESKVVESQALDRLAMAARPMLHSNVTVSAPPLILIRWLLESVKYEESYLEIRTAPDQSAQAVFAIRLPDEHAAIWQSNLAMVVQSVTGFAPLPKAKGAGWSVVSSTNGGHIELSRGGEWTLVGMAKGENMILPEMLRYIHEQEKPFPFAVPNTWLSADFDLRWVAERLHLANKIPENLPKVSLFVTGDGGYALTHATLTFPHSSPTENLESWVVPSGMIHEPVTSLIAARSMQPLLHGIGWQNIFGTAEAPNEVFFWSRPGNPFQLYAAALAPNAESQMATLTSNLLTKANPWLMNNGPRVNNSSIPLFKELPDGSGAQWMLEGVWPFINAKKIGNQNFLFTGITPEQNSGSTTSLQQERLEKLLSGTNLVYSEWENTAVRLSDWLPVLQTARVLAHKPPLPEKSLSLEWFNALEPRLEKTETRVTRTSPTTLELYRKSTVGLDALELHLFADWLESPTFPKGLHTFSAPPADAAH